MKWLGRVLQSIVGLALVLLGLLVADFIMFVVDIARLKAGGR